MHSLKSNSAPSHSKRETSIGRARLLSRPWSLVRKYLRITTSLHSLTAAWGFRIRPACRWRNFRNVRPLPTTPNPVVLLLGIVHPRASRLPPPGPAEYLQNLAGVP